MSALIFSIGVVVGFLGFGFIIKLPDEKDFQLCKVRNLALMIANSSDEPACYKEPNCPMNGGVGFDNHCNMKCPFVLANKIIAVIDGEHGNGY